MKEHPYAEIRNNKIFRKAFLEFPVKEIGEVRDTVELAIKYFEDRFRIAEDKVGQLEKDIEISENKGSYLMKVIHMQNYLVNFDGLGDFGELIGRLEKHENTLKEIVSKNRIRNLKIKNEFLEELEKLVDHYNLNEAFSGINEIKTKWVRTGAVPEDDKDEIENRYNTLINHFFKRQKSFYDDKNSMVEEHTLEYKELIATGIKLEDQQDIEKSFNELKKLQQQWKDTANIPSEIYEPLISQFNEICEKVFNRYTEFKKGEQVKKTQELEKQVETRKKIIEEFVKDIEKENDLKQKLKTYKSQWDKQGVFFHKQIKELNDQFQYLSRKAIEISFVDNIVKGKIKSFATLKQNDKLKARIRILNSLVERDRKDLVQIEENLGMFTSKTGTIDKMVNSKVFNKKLNLEIKKELLTNYTARLKSV